MDNWSDDRKFWEAMEPALCAPSRIALADGDVDAILAARNIRPGARVLDMGCGCGAHAVAFARRGYTVTGVDTSRRLISRARVAARNAGAKVEFVEADMRAFRRPAEFDLACSLYTSFGYFDDVQNLAVLENLRANLRGGGALLLDVTGREVAARQFQERRWTEVNGILYLELCAAADDWSALVSDWIVVKDSRRSDFRVRQRLYSGSELRDMLVSVGFSEVRISGNLDCKSPYDHSSRRLVALARIPA